MGPFVPVRQGLPDQWTLLQQVLDHRAGDVLATRGDDDLLLAVDDLQEAVRVQFADVAGVQPSVGVDQAGG
ncbi:hypothetical protein [Actinomadura rugatobispora]|uniref:Uncharacterized protein n=1 Tax=Actinomadura rugatobispora TaxID=1994 RepID=A0ABW1A4B5_9ACTN